VVTGAVDVLYNGHADVIVQQQSTGATYYAQEGSSGFVQWGVVPNGLGTHGLVVSWWPKPKGQSESENRIHIS
jgi:hypothetical protein